MVALFALLAVAIGAGVTLQAGVNAELARWVGGPLRAASVSFLVGMVGIVLVTLIATRGLVGTSRAGNAPWWAWFGGLFGALFVAASTALAPRVGALNLFVAVVLGQVLCSLVLDRFGLLYREHPLTGGRIAGALLVAVGVALVRIF